MVKSAPKQGPWMRTCPLTSDGQHPWIHSVDRASASTRTMRWVKAADKRWRHAAHCTWPLAIDGRAYRRRTKRR